MKSVNSFTHVAAFYDELMKTVPYRMWASYYQLLLAHQSVKPAHVLDVCCGTGTMGDLLFNEGFMVTGFDVSEEMIREAKLKALVQNRPLQFFVADAVDVNLERTFDGAFSFYDSLNNITDPARLQMAFSRVAAHLPAGASWIFDLNTAYAFEKRMFDQQNLRANAKLRYKWTGEWDVNRRIIEVTMKFWRDGVEIEEIHRQRAHPLDEITEMLALAGFEQLQIFNSYTLDRPTKKSDRVHFACIKT